MSLSMTVYMENYGFSVTNYMIGLLALILIMALVRTRSLSYVTCAAILAFTFCFLSTKPFFRCTSLGILPML